MSFRCRRYSVGIADGRYAGDYPGAGAPNKDSHSSPWLEGQGPPARYGDEGQETAARLVKSLTERHERLLAELKPDEQEALAYGLSALIRALRTI